ncbi:hypothetical protein [Gordonia sp. (in: high G+C Gram-positive bacteria)]|uniref:Rv0361 family membrane protein n=1 Tax=Gordonia sp. (in: high G+C Gram-positive bacteria) TaxID=84139 RepID=UPI0039E347A0
MADSPDDDMGRLDAELDERDAPTRAPIIAALVVIAILIIVILIAQWTHPFSSRLSPEDSVRVAINDQYTARNALNYESYQRITCAPKIEPREAFLAENQRSRDENGKIVIPQINDVVIDGDKATASVVWNFEKKPDAKTTTPTTLVRQDDGWKVCS